jgi:colanic acid/amylovoran biosynthesis glycosyltransferase
MAASFREKKGIPYAIKAFASAIQKFPRMELRIIGGAQSANEQRLLKHCKALAKHESITHKVYFLGYLNYEQYLQEAEHAHIFLAPSVTAQNGDTEGGAPVSVIEASAFGMPVIASRHCDIPEVIKDGESGILVDERDVDGLTKAILELATSPNQWAKMGRVGRRHIESEYDINKQVAKLEDIYNNVRG